MFSQQTATAGTAEQLTPTTQTRSRSLRASPGAGLASLLEGLSLSGGATATATTWAVALKPPKSSSAVTTDCAAGGRWEAEAPVDEWLAARLLGQVGPGAVPRVAPCAGGAVPRVAPCWGCWWDLDGEPSAQRLPGAVTVTPRVTPSQAKPAAVMVMLSVMPSHRPPPAHGAAAGLDRVGGVQRRAARGLRPVRRQVWPLQGRALLEQVAHRLAGALGPRLATRAEQRSAAAHCVQRAALRPILRLAQPAPQRGADAPHLRCAEGWGQGGGGAVKDHCWPQRLRRSSAAGRPGLDSLACVLPFTLGCRRPGSRHGCLHLRGAGISG